MIQTSTEFSTKFKPSSNQIVDQITTKYIWFATEYQILIFGNKPNIELFAKYIRSQSNIELFGFSLDYKITSLLTCIEYHESKLAT